MEKSTRDRLFWSGATPAGTRIEVRYDDWYPGMVMLRIEGYVQVPLPPALSGALSDALEAARVSVEGMAPQTAQAVSEPQEER